MATKRPKAALSAQAKYDAAGQGRRVKGWNAPSSGPLRAVDGLVRIRDRARDATRNDWAGESGIQKWTTALVGVGITPRWENPDHAAMWQEYVPICDADGVLDFYGQTALAVRSWLASGEVFIRRRPRREYPYVQVQLVESDYVPMLDADQYAGLPEGNTIRQGIERDKYGRRTAYWMYREHPGDGLVTGPRAGDLIRVASSQVSHVFEPTRPGQLRGVSSLAPVLVRLRASMDFEDAVLDRQKLANLFVGFMTRAMPASWEGVETDPLTGLPVWYDKSGQPMAGIEPGAFNELAPGENVTFANPPEAGTSFPDYMRTTHMGTAAGQGLPYETFAGDIREVSDRTLRIVIQEFRRFAEQRQWHTVVPMVCRPVVRWWAQAQALAGRVSVRESEVLAAPEWQPHGWEYIHPVQDVQGKILARDAGFISTSSVISARGDDPRKVLAERKADEVSGLTPTPAATTTQGV